MWYDETVNYVEQDSRAEHKIAGMKTFSKRWEKFGRDAPYLKRNPVKFTRNAARLPLHPRIAALTRRPSLATVAYGVVY